MDVRPQAELGLPGKLYRVRKFYDDENNCWYRLVFSHIAGESSCMAEVRNGYVKVDRSIFLEILRLRKTNRFQIRVGEAKKDSICIHSDFFDALMEEYREDS